MNKTTRWCGRSLLGFGLALLFGVSSVTQASQELWVHRIEIFEQELADFVESAQSFRERASDLSPRQQEEEVEKLLSIAGRVSQIYFASLHLDHDQEFNSSLKQVLSEYQELRVFFYLIGNQMVDQARLIIGDREKFEQSFRLWSAAGGAVLGLAGGSALIYFRAPGTQSVFGKVFALAILTGGGAAAGYYASPHVVGQFVPIDPDVLTARDFVLKYPNGEDFIRRTGSSTQDISERLSQLERSFYEQIPIR
ncbi:MAG: hypothetical protein EA369_03715 [Bradymonadales bacterium]|nr:MAG: hypothetical protein EA369_03715 [Bradymonadales bacterium]